jgi:ubiquinone biosynthesis protein UbiJ
MAAKETTLTEVGDMLAHVVVHIATKEDVALLDTRIENLRTEMTDQFEHADKQFRATHDRLRDMAADVTVIHRGVERLEEQGASNAGLQRKLTTFSRA